MKTEVISSNASKEGIVAKARRQKHQQTKWTCGGHILAWDRKSRTEEPEAVIAIGGNCKWWPIGLDALPKWGIKTDRNRVWWRLPMFERALSCFMEWWYLNGYCHIETEVLKWKLQLMISGWFEVLGSTVPVMDRARVTHSTAITSPAYSWNLKTTMIIIHQRDTVMNGSQRIRFQRNGMQNNRNGFLNNGSPILFFRGIKVQS